LAPAFEVIEITNSSLLAPWRVRLRATEQYREFIFFMQPVHDRDAVIAEAIRDVFREHLARWNAARS
jgi:hypothetical protein